MNLPLALMNVALAILNGLMAYHNFEGGNYGIALFNAWASGFCSAGSMAIFLNGIMR